MNRYMAGALAGLAATVPMTLTMAFLHRLLPAERRRPLPPREITTNVAEKAEVEEYLDDEGKIQGATLIAHFGYGAAMGALYAPLVSAPAAEAASSGITRGIAYGLAVWAGSYLGLLPATSIFPSATEQPATRNALMITAHLVWGGALGVAYEQLIRRSSDRPRNP